VSRPLKRVLFVCIGNSCRSQMAEGFARAYGSDVMVPASAGVAPATGVAPDTLDAMNEKGIDLKDHFPKAMRHLAHVEFDLVVNMSGQKLPSPVKAPVREWQVDDPIGMKYENHCEIRDEVERRVMGLILELRREQSAPEFRGQGSGRLKL
jgi:arsenate reductase (thioredoxin)